jgi:hypothetical protein
MRKQFIAMAAGVALGVATMATAAMAAPLGGGGHFGGGGHASFGGGGHPNFGGVHSFAAPRANMSSNFATPHGNFATPRGNFAANNWQGNWHHGHRGGFYGPGFGVYAFGGYGPDYYDYYDSPDYVYSDGCYQQQLVQTPYGAQWQLVDVCQ